MDNKYVYYVKEDLEKNPPFIQDTKQMESMKDLGKTKESFRGTTGRCGF